MTRLEELLAEAARLRDERDAAQDRLSEAEEAVTEERFRDVPRYQVGDVILVKRMLFGKVKLWPAKIIYVSLHYAAGSYSENYEPDPGGSWESKTVSYSVYYQQKDGTFGGTSVGAYHTSDVAGLAPASATEEVSHD